MSELVDKYIKFSAPEYVVLKYKDAEILYVEANKLDSALNAADKLKDIIDIMNKKVYNNKIYFFVLSMCTASLFLIIPLCVIYFISIKH